MDIIENLRDSGVNTASYFEASRYANQFTNREDVTTQFYQDRIRNIFGLEVNPGFTKEAEVMFRYMIAETVRLHEQKQPVTPEAILEIATRATDTFFKRFPWYVPGFRTETDGPAEGNVTMVTPTTDAADIQLSRSTNGKRTNPRGAKQEAARIIVVDGTSKSETNQMIIQKMMKQLDMSKECATTYFYSIRKSLRDNKESA